MLNKNQELIKMRAKGIFFPIPKRKKSKDLILSRYGKMQEVLAEHLVLFCFILFMVNFQ